MRAEREASAACESIMREKRTYRRDGDVAVASTLAVYDPARPSLSLSSTLRRGAVTASVFVARAQVSHRRRKVFDPTLSLAPPHSDAPLLLRRAQPRSRSCSCRDANGGARVNVVGRQSFRGLRRSRRDDVPCAPMSLVISTRCESTAYNSREDAVDVSPAWHDRSAYARSLGGREEGRERQREK